MQTQTQTLETSISPRYVQNWTEHHALREVRQNWQDVITECECDGRIEYDDVMGVATFIDTGPGLQLRHLAMGISEKSENAIGQFGEGLKLAMLVMARSGRVIEVRTGDKCIVPMIRHSSGYDTDVLVFSVTEVAPIEGTHVLVECSRDELHSSSSVFESYVSSLEGFEWLETGKVSLLNGEGGAVYVNGAELERLDNMGLNYHLTSSDRNMVNRDRTSYNRQVMDREINRLVANLQEYRAIEAVMSAMLKGGRESYEGGMWIYRGSNFNIALWKRAWDTVAGENAVIGVDSRSDDQVVRMGYSVHALGGGWTGLLRECGVKTSTDIVRHGLMSEGNVDPADLEPEERFNLNWACRYMKTYTGVSDRPIVCDRLYAEGSSVQVHGMYDRETDSIYLNRSILWDQRETLHVLLHEAVHKTSRCSDLTDGFQRALLDITVDHVISKTKRR